MIKLHQRETPNSRICKQYRKDKPTNIRITVRRRPEALSSPQRRLWRSDHESEEQAEEKSEEASRKNLRQYPKNLEKPLEKNRKRNRPKDEEYAKGPEECEEYADESGEKYEKTV